MSHQNDNDVEGLSGALQKLPVPFRSMARHEFRRAFLEDGYADMIGPEVIHYGGKDGGPLKKAILLIIHCETFIFDLFFVPVRTMHLVPVVGRAYFSPPPTYVGQVN